MIKKNGNLFLKFKIQYKTILMVKKLTLFSNCLLLFFYSFSQFTDYKNQWIDYSKTYYKFEIGPFGYDIVGAPVPEGVVRISAAMLAAAGLANVPAEQLQLWNNGKEVPIYTSKPTGILSSNDYIEFWGHINDGTFDTELYPNPSYQLSTHWSLQTDSASYFLTVNSSGTNKRLVPANNKVAASSLKADKNFLYTAGRYYHYEINPGYAVVTSVVNLYSSTYDKGEGWVSRPVHPDACGCGGDIPQGFSPMYLDTSGGNMTATIAFVGNAASNRYVEAFLDNTFIGKAEMDYFNDTTLVIPNIPAKTITGDYGVVLMRDSSDNDYDEMRISKVEIKYPHLFNFGGASSFAFNLSPAPSEGRLIKITNFNKGTSVPILYDISNGLRYVGDTSKSGLIRFLLQPSSKEYNLVLVRDDGSTATTVNSLQQRNFTDYNKKSNQGNYLIISNPLLYGNGSNNYVEQYRVYRQTHAGGGFTSKVIDINEITDQFAYGIKKHPLAIKNFLQFARNKFSSTPRFVFLIGKGVTYDNYYYNQADPMDDQLDLVPTWGYPGSDNLLSSSDYTAIPATPIGRLSAISSDEVGNYLNKIKQYESAQQDTVQTFANKSWMKNVLQLVGADDASTGLVLDKYMKRYAAIISDTLFGANVISYSKTANPAGYPDAVTNFKNTFNSGSALVSYFGHSSSVRLDFNLDNPADYNNEGKYPIFIVNGCLAGNIFDYDQSRLGAPSTISEKFVLQPNVGAIGYLATSSYGVSDYLNIFTNKFYKEIANIDYGLGFGEIMKDGITKGLNFTGFSDFYGRIQAEQYTFNGDPAIKFYNFSKPDYVIDSSNIHITPSYISEADNSFQVKIFINNIGRATNDSVHFSLTRKYPSGKKEVVLSEWLPNLYSEDSVTITLPIVADRDKGGNLLTANIDDNNTVDELSETNNIASVHFVVSASDIRPIYPFNYSVVNKGNTLLYASTADPLAASAKYNAEADTSALFNSPAEINLSVTSVGGLLKLGNIQLPLDKTVYYWRVAKKDSAMHWNTFSFLHNAQGSSGFAQAHFYQFTQSTFDDISLDSASEKFVFNKGLTNVFINHAIYPTSGTEDADFAVSVNGAFVTQSACVGSSIIFNVFDSSLFKPWVNTADAFGAGGVCDPTRAINFEYSTLSPDMRDSAAKFFDSIPNGDYVIAREIYNIGDDDWASVWASDTSLYGTNNSLYYRLKSQGLPIDSFYYPRTFIFLFRKNDSTAFAPQSIFTQGLYDNITLSENISTSDSVGYITSPTFGPAKNWNTVMWNGYASDTNDVASVQVIGIKPDGTQKVFYTLDNTQHSFDVSGIDANNFPFMQLKMKNQDSITVMPYQLKNWNVSYMPSSETGIAPNLGINLADTFIYYHAANTAFDTLSGFISFKNASITKVDSLKAIIILFDKSNNADTFLLPDTKSILPGDTLNLSFAINVGALAAGKYNFYIAVSPVGKAYDQYSFNNSLYKYIQIKRQLTSLFAITFDANPLQTEVAGKWIVQNDDAVNRYEMQHSIDNINFYTVGILPKQDGNLYNLAHRNPVEGKNYYRIKASNNDSSIHYSATREVDFNVKNAVQVYPNPFMKQLNIALGANKNVVVKIINGQGQQVYQQNFNGTNATIDGSSFAAGNYLLIIDDGTEKKTLKVEKK